MGSPMDGVKAVKESRADAVAIANILHYKKYNLHDIRNIFHEHNIKVRTYDEKN
jgi:imidazole glycerol phosphate synthase subunit HisF